MKKKLIDKHDKAKKQEATKALGSSRFSMTMIWIPALLVALITFLVYLPALQNGFVNWDDQLYVYENQNIRAINLKFLKWSASAEANPTWHPMTLFSIALDYRTWDINPFGYHLTNNLLH